jgi:hypothetical protein
MMDLRLALTVLIASLAAPHSYSQQLESYSVPRTEHGHPDFQGVWMLKFLTPLERPDGVQNLIITPEQARELAMGSQFQLAEVTDPDDYINGANSLGLVQGEYRSSIIVKPEDGKIPFSETGLALAEQIGTSWGQLFDHVAQRPPAERCIGGVGSAPIRPFPFGLPSQIVQNHDHVLIYTEDATGVRIINLYDSNRPQALRSITGSSIGKWQGGTLNVQTTHFSVDHPGRENVGRVVLIGNNTRVMESFTRVSESELLYQYTVEDSSFYTEPWSGEFSFLWLDASAYEWSCHEGNYSLPGILRGGQIEAARLEEEESNRN